MDDPLKDLAAGAERIKPFAAPVSRKKLIRYDYRLYDGRVFSCVKPSLTECRDARDAFLLDEDRERVAQLKRRSA